MLVAYNPTLTGYHEIRANSYQTEEWYNDIGKFTLIVPPTNYNIQHLVKGAILYAHDAGDRQRRGRCQRNRKP